MTLPPLLSDNLSSPTSPRSTTQEDISPSPETESKRRLCEPTSSFLSQVLGRTLSKTPLKRVSRTSKRKTSSKSSNWIVPYTWVSPNTSRDGNVKVQEQENYKVLQPDPRGSRHRTSDITGSHGMCHGSYILHKSLLFTFLLQISLFE